MPLLFHNNQFIDESQPIFRADDRAWKYGDGLFESIVVFNGIAPLLPYHYERLKRSAEILLIDLPAFFDFDWFKATIKELLDRNGYVNARVRVQASRSSGGLYLPSTNESDILITAGAIENSMFEWSSIKANFLPYRVDMGVLSNLKTISKIQYVMSALHAQKVGAQECFLFNTKGTLAEAINSNVFIIRGDMILTPALTNGGVNGVMRRYLIEMLEETHKVVQSDVLMNDIDEADEIFLTNAVRGIQSVAVVGSVVYTDQMTRILFKQLNDRIASLTQNK